MNVALVQLCSFGDCLYATLVARQIKRDFPGCHLTWVIGDRYSSLLQGNPDVDAVHAIPIQGVESALSSGWIEARQWVAGQLASGALDRAFFTQILPDNLGLCDGMIRSTLYRAYGRPVAGPHRPVVVLDEAERRRVAEFATTHRLDEFEHVFLFECGPRSGQSLISPSRAERLARDVAAAHPRVAFCLSCDRPLATTTSQIIDASTLSFRENAELARYCTGLIGCSSGITWLCTSSAGKLLPMLQILTRNRTPFFFASVCLDFERFGLDAKLVIELAEPTNEQIAACLKTWIERSHDAARQEFHVPVRFNRENAEGVFRGVRSARGYPAALSALLRFVMANGAATIPWEMLWSDLGQGFSSASRAILAGLGLLPATRAVWRRLRRAPRTETPPPNGR